MTQTPASTLYRRAALSPRTLTRVILVLLLLLALVIGWGIARGGYTVSFDTDGGTPLAGTRIRYGACLAPPEVPQKDHYVFAGWYSDADRLCAFDFTEAVLCDHDITLYAAWLPIEIPERKESKP